MAKVPSEQPLYLGMRRGRAAAPIPQLSPDIVHNRGGLTYAESAPSAKSLHTMAMSGCHPLRGVATYQARMLRSRTRTRTTSRGKAREATKKQQKLEREREGRPI